MVEAAGGYGKSVLGAELVQHWGSLGIEVQLEHAGVPAVLLAAKLRRAVLRAGLTDAAAAAEPSQDAQGTVEALLAALVNEQCALVIDDAHNAAADAAALMAYMAAHLRGEPRLVVLARKLPKGAGHLRRADYLQLSAGDLALTVKETLAVCQAGFGLSTTAETAKVLDQATGGWTAATVLAAARAARTGETVKALAKYVAGADHAAGAVTAMLQDALEALGLNRQRLLAQVARLPLLDADLVAAATGDETLFEDGLRAGIPFTPGSGRWSDMPGPVREHLAGFWPTDQEVVRRAARQYRSRGELAAALQLLVACGDAAEAVAVLGVTGPEVADALEPLELLALLDQLPLEAFEAYPNALVVTARHIAVAGQYEKGRALAERAHEIALRTEDRVLERSASAELLTYLVQRLDLPSAEREARHILANAAQEERVTRARAYNHLGVALCGRLKGARAHDEGVLAEAEECFSRASELLRGLGMPSALTRVVAYWTVKVEFQQGRAEAAMSRIEEALLLVADRPRSWGYLMIWRAWFAADLGLDDQCRASIAEIFRVAGQLGVDTLWAQGHWKSAILASYSGDAAATLDHLRQAELHKGSWWGPGSGDFLSEAADILDRVGHVALAREYLARVKAEPKDAADLVALSEAAIEARHGDPLLAEQLLVNVSDRPIGQREHWRVLLFRGFAAFRHGDHERAGALAAQAFEEAARLGQPNLPMIRERLITEQLLGLAASTGQPAAIALEAGSLPTSVSILGSFQLTIAGSPVPLRHGQEAQLLKFVAASEGHVHAEQAIEALWPEVGRAAGRNRLRTVLNRLRRLAGDVLARDGEMLVVGEAVRIDLLDFLAQAQRALALATNDLPLAAAMAKGAMVTYRGEVLPEDRYEDWAEKVRERARSTMLDLLDLCAQDAVARGDLDVLRRTVERTIELAPYDDFRYLRAASAFFEQGRRGEALAVVRRARSAFSELGINPPRSLLDLEEAIVA
ncbi:MAG TPA: BTAD domain-containing putative transcriptional regulator [Acidimicrobiales bacterium]|nr:BTAD domain-containing putative transcriptional regulator [Acidimicrobiales bacterium]